MMRKVPRVPKAVLSILSSSGLDEATCACEHAQVRPED